jgi:hypothetical protein
MQKRSEERPGWIRLVHLRQIYFSEVGLDFFELFEGGAEVFVVFGRDHVWVRKVVGFLKASAPQANMFTLTMSRWRSSLNEKQRQRPSGFSSEQVGLSL